MKDRPSQVQARLAAGSPQAQVLAPLVLVLGWRAGLPIGQLDDLVLAGALIVRWLPCVR